MIPQIDSALAMGLVGGLHCAGMCGPLAASCPTNLPGKYLLGRAVSYAFMGALMGSAGAPLMHALPIGVLTGIATAVVVALALLQAWRVLRPPREPKLVQLNRPKKANGVRLLLRKLMATLPSHGLGLGLLTGVLPCGLLVGAWLLAASTGSPVAGAQVMLALSVATLPGLLAPLLLKSWLTRRSLPRWAYGAAWLSLAIWLAIRPFWVESGACH